MTFPSEGLAKLPTELDLERHRSIARAIGWLRLGPGNPIRLPCGDIISRVGWTDPKGRTRWALPEWEGYILPDFSGSRDACALFEEWLRVQATSGGKRDKARLAAYNKSVGVLSSDIPGGACMAPPKIRMDAFLAIVSPPDSV